jgi:hypothetical protein
MIIELAVLYVDDKFLRQVTRGDNPVSPPDLVYILYSFWIFIRISTVYLICPFYCRQGREY